MSTQQFGLAIFSVLALSWVGGLAVAFWLLNAPERAAQRPYREWRRSKPRNCQFPRCNPADAMEGLCCGWVEGAPARRIRIPIETTRGMEVAAHLQAYNRLSSRPAPALLPSHKHIYDNPAWDDWPAGDPGLFGPGLAIALGSGPSPVGEDRATATLPLPSAGPEPSAPSTPTVYAPPPVSDSSGGSMPE